MCHFPAIAEDKKQDNNGYCRLKETTGQEKTWSVSEKAMLYMD